MGGPQLPSPCILAFPLHTPRLPDLRQPLGAQYSRKGAAFRPPRCAGPAGPPASALQRASKAHAKAAGALQPLPEAPVQPTQSREPPLTQATNAPGSPAASMRGWSVVTGAESWTPQLSAPRAAAVAALMPAAPAAADGPAPAPFMPPQHSAVVSTGGPDRQAGAAGKVLRPPACSCQFRSSFPSQLLLYRALISVAPPRPPAIRAGEALPARCPHLVTSRLWAAAAPAACPSSTSTCRCRRVGARESQPSIAGPSWAVRRLPAGRHMQPNLRSTLSALRLASSCRAWPRVCLWALPLWPPPAPWPPPRGTAAGAPAAATWTPRS